MSEISHNKMLSYLTTLEKCGSNIESGMFQDEESIISEIIDTVKAHEAIKQILNNNREDLK